MQLAMKRRLWLCCQVSCKKLSRSHHYVIAKITTRSNINNSMLYQQRETCNPLFFYLLAQIQHIKEYSSSSLSCQLKLISFLLHFEHRFRFLVWLSRVLTLSFLPQQNQQFLSSERKKQHILDSILYSYHRGCLYGLEQLLSHRFRQEAKLN